MLSRRLAACLALVFLLILSFPSLARAYLDPGAGSYFFQLLLAAVVGLGFLVKVYWKRIKAHWTRLRARRSRAHRADRPDDGC